MTATLAHKAIRNIFFSGLRLLSNSGAAIFTSAIIARTLGPERMGTYSYTLWLVGALSIFANVGLPGAITKYVSEFVGSGHTSTAKQLANRLLRTQLAVAVVISVVTASCAFFSTAHRSIIVLAAIMISAQALQQGLNAVLAGLQEFGRIALLGFWMGLMQMACIGVAALLHAGVIGMVWATLIALWGGTLLFYRSVRDSFRHLPSDASLPLASTQDALGRVKTFVLTGSYILLLDTIVWQRSEVLFLKWYSLVTQIAFYTIAYSLASKLNDLTTIMSSVMLPRYSESYGRSGLGELRQAFITDLKYLQMLVVPVCILGVVVAKPAVLLIYGSAYLPMVMPLRILIASVTFTSMGVVASSLVIGTDKQSFIAKFGTLIAILNITLDLILIPKHGALGASIANSSAQIAGVAGGMAYVLHYIKVGFPWKVTATIYGAAGLAAGPLAYFSNRLHPNTAVLAGLLVFGTTLYLVILAFSGQLTMRTLNTLREALYGNTDPLERFKSRDIA
jgi:O-antigen/teichoic acid export membrane protein